MTPNLNKTSRMGWPSESGEAPEGHDGPEGEEQPRVRRRVAAQAADDDSDDDELDLEGEREFLEDSLCTYLREIGRVKLLSGAEERDLGRSLETSAYLKKMGKAATDDGGAGPVQVVKRMLLRLVGLRAIIGPFGSTLGLHPDPALGALAGAQVPTAVPTDDSPDVGPVAQFAADSGMETDSMRLLLTEVCALGNAIPPEAQNRRT